METSQKKPESLETRRKVKQIIEDFLRNKSHAPSEILALLLNIFIEIFSAKPQIFVEFFLDLHKTLEKRIIFMRHGQSEYNKWREKSTCNLPCFYRNKPSNHDPQLSETGRKQAETAFFGFTQGKSLEKQAFDAIFVSPLTRALQTCEIFLRNFKEKTDVFACDLLRERMDYACDIGTKLSILRENFKNVDFSLVFDEFWWRFPKKSSENPEKSPEKSEKKVKEKEPVSKEKKKLVYLRVSLFVMWVLVNEEKTVFVVSHQNVFQCLFNNFAFFSEKIKNCEIQELSIEKLGEFLWKASFLLRKLRGKKL